MPARLSVLILEYSALAVQSRTLTRPLSADAAVGGGQQSLGHLYFNNPAHAYDPTPRKRYARELEGEARTIGLPQRCSSVVDAHKPHGSLKLLLPSSFHCGLWRTEDNCHGQKATLREPGRTWSLRSDQHATGSVRAGWRDKVCRHVLSPYGA